MLTSALDEDHLHQLIEQAWVVSEVQKLAADGVEVGVRQFVKQDSNLAHCLVELVLLGQRLLAEAIGASFLVREVELCHVIWSLLVVCLHAEDEFESVHFLRLWFFHFWCFGLGLCLERRLIGLEWVQLGCRLSRFSWLLGLLLAWLILCSLLLRTNSNFVVLLL